MVVVDSAGRRDPGLRSKKQVARDSLCAVLCDDSSLQKSAALTLARASATEGASLEVLLSLVRGELPNCMPSFSISKSAFLPKARWLDGSGLFPSEDDVVGTNTLKECLQSPEAWERARVVALRALLVQRGGDPVSLEELLPHVVVGVKPESKKQVTYCRETAVALAVAFAEAIPDGDSFEFSVLQMALVNEDVKIPVLQTVIERAMGEPALLPRVLKLLRRMMDTENATPVFDLVGDAPRSPSLAVFAMVHFCSINAQCLVSAVPRALHVIDFHAADSGGLRLMCLLVCAVRLSDVKSVPIRRKYAKFLHSKLVGRAYGGYAEDIAEALKSRPNVIRVIVDAIVTTIFAVTRNSQPVYELVLIVSALLELLLTATSAAAERTPDMKLPTAALDVASLLKVRALVSHLTHCGISMENDHRLDPLLASISVAVSDDGIFAYANQFDFSAQFFIEEVDVWGDIVALCVDDYGLGLFNAVKARVQSAADVVWGFNSLQRLYVGVAITKDTELVTESPDLHGSVVHISEGWSLRDAMKVALATLTLNVSTHASALAYIAAVAARNNEEALFFVSALVDSTLFLLRNCAVLPWEVAFKMVEMNIVMLARLSRHRLALPIVFSAFRYLFGHQLMQQCRDEVSQFYRFDARWRCLLLCHSDIPASKVVDTPTPERLQAMTARDREVYMIVFRSLCKYRPEDALKYVNDLGALFAEYPVMAIDGCTRMCKNDVMDFGIAYRVYVASLLQSNLGNTAVVGAVGSFFCDYLKLVSMRIQGQVTDEDVEDLNLIMINLLQLAALDDLHGVTAIAALLKSPLWAKLQTLRNWHLNQECDCYSLLDRIKKRQLKCTFAKLDPRFFEFDFTAFIGADAGEETSDPASTHGQSLLISAVIDAESDATSRATLLSRRNEAVLGFNREIRRVTRELLKELGHSKPTISSFRFILESDEVDTRISVADRGIAACVLPMQGAESGIGNVRLLHLPTLFKLYGIIIAGRQFNRDVVCENAYDGILSGGSAMGGRVIAEMALLVNMPSDPRNAMLVTHMLLHLKEMGESINAAKSDSEHLSCDKTVVYAFALAYMHCQHCVVTEFPLVILELLRSALPKFNVYAELADMLCLVLGTVYRYTNLHFYITEVILSLFSDYLDATPNHGVRIGWVLGLCNLIEDVPRDSINVLEPLMSRILSLVVNDDLPQAQRSLLAVPLAQYWALKKCNDVGSAIANLLVETCATTPVDPCTMLLLAYCHYVGFEPHLVGKGCEVTGCDTCSGMCTGDNTEGVGGVDKGCCACDTRVPGWAGNDGATGFSSGRTLGSNHSLKQGCVHVFSGKTGCQNVDDKRGRCSGATAFFEGDTTLLSNSLKDGNAVGGDRVSDKLQETLMACIRANLSGDDVVKDLLIVATMLLNGFPYIAPTRNACFKRLLRNKNGWSVLYKDLSTALAAIAYQETVQVTMATAAKSSRYSRSRGSTTSAHQYPLATQMKSDESQWGDESAVLVAIMQLSVIKKFLASQAELDCYNEDGSIGNTLSEIRRKPHSFKLLSALTLCKPLKLTLWDIISFEDTECSCERELVLRIYCLHGQINRYLMEHLASASKYFGCFDRRLKVSFLNCVRLAFWSIDFNSLRLVLSYIADFDDLDVLLTIETLLESCVYLMKGSDGTGLNGEEFASKVLDQLLHPIIVQVVSRSKRHKAAVCLYYKAMPHINVDQRAELVTTVNSSDIALKSLLCGVCDAAEAPFTFNECFAHLVTQNVSVSNVVLYCYVNVHRHMEVMLHCIHVLNVNTNSEQITLVSLALMALVAERNVASYLLELAFDGAKIEANAKHELRHIATLDVYEFIRLKRQPNLFYYDTIDARTLAKSANIPATAPGTWKNCGLEATPLGCLLPMAKDRHVPNWLPKLGNLALDRRKQSLLPMDLPARKMISSVTEVDAEHLLVDNAVVIMSAYKAHLIERHPAHPGLRDIMAFLNTRLA
ncbi:methyl-accepting chemotaxis, putative [Babesia ovata]|uniref:Methyl-accepting chemotaxis, putative n=1 Tax=Babesia ovata TaxID=189622 RepID=A0A2H6KCT2_9APIC|nr:methyl-accepting chemotaxis, putative [Babesia ovata]GBE60784.1 methyl-accepting chemotaxis, putative [Babesia ovata]